MRSLLMVALVLMLVPRGDAAGRLGLVGHELGRFDPDSLRLTGESLEVGEPHAPGALSPSGRLLAFGLSQSAAGGAGRVGLAIVDASSLRVRHEVQTGIAAEQVAFPGDVVALLQDGAVVVVDPDTGAIVRRISGAVPSRCIFSARPVVVGGSVAFVAPGNDGVARLAVVDPDGAVRSRRLSGLRVRGSTRSCGGIGLVGVGRRLVLAAGGRVASVPLTTLRPSYRPVPLKTGCCSARWSVASLPEGGVAVAAETRSGPLGRNRRAAGLVVLDPSLRVRWRDRRAGAVAATGRRVLAVGEGVRGYDLNGRRRFSALRGASIFHAEAGAGRFYVATTRRLVILDPATGRVRARHPNTLAGLWFV